MKASTQLDKAIFHLTPTRTRCDLIIIANDKEEKIASGLVKPFLMHLKTAEEQIAKGGYSIMLVPELGKNGSWFTKGTMERFVRFVSTPEVLERVYTIELEILQIEEAIIVQASNDRGLNTIQDHQTKHVASNEGNIAMVDANEEKAIVLFKPSLQVPETSGSKTEEGNSKVQLLKVLETRKIMLQKEQGMAFARAVAAGFDMDQMISLMSFADCFAALRLMNACTRFMDLWNKKHETGQWLEIDAAEAMSGKSDFSAMNASGIVFSSVADKQNECHNEAASESNINAGSETTADGRPATFHQAPGGPQEYFQFPQTMFPGWPMHAPPGALPMFQAYPMQGMPYYPNYSGNVPYYQPPFPSTQDSGSGFGHRTGQKRESMDSRDSNTVSEPLEDASKTRSQDDFELEKEASCGQESRTKAGKLDKKQSGMVVIRNINYIASKKHNSSGSESDSDFDLDPENEAGELDSDDADRMQKNPSRSSNKKGIQGKSMDEVRLRDTDDAYGKDGAHWEAFQNCLLRGASEDSHTAKDLMFEMGKNVQIKRQQSSSGDDPLAVPGQYQVDMQDRNIPEFHKVSENLAHIPRMSNDEVSTSGRGARYGNCRGLTNDQMDLQFIETNGRTVMSRTANDSFMVNGLEKQFNLENSSNPLAVNGFECATKNLDRNTSQSMADESFIIPFRLMSLDPDRKVIDVDAELPAPKQNSENDSSRVGSHAHYEPHDLSLMPDRGAEEGSVGYDPALDYEMQFCTEVASSQNKRNKQLLNDVKEVSKISEKDKKSKTTPASLDKKKMGGPIRKAKPSKASPLDDARARAERLRTYKADLQKLKKENEEAEIKRLEALKMERQKRIAAKGCSAFVQSPLPSRQTQKQLQTKPSPISNKGSKFSDSEPGSSSPLQRSKIRSASIGSYDTQKTSKAIKSCDGSISAENNRLSRSVSSLSEPKRETANTPPDSKANMARIKRLSEPKSFNSHPVSSVKTRSTKPAKPKGIEEPESNKISAIVNHDRSKTATLPELKVRTSKGPLNASENKSSAKEKTQKKNIGSEPSAVSETAKLEMNCDETSHQRDEDDTRVIEKTVVMFEHPKPSYPVVHELKEKIEVVGGHHYSDRDIGQKIEVVSEYAAIRAPPLPVDGIETEPFPMQLQEQAVLYEVSNNLSEEELPALALTAEKPYQAPFARVSSLEDPCTRNSEYGKAPLTSLKVLSTSAETTGPHISDFQSLKSEKIPENLKKPQVKDPSKGFRRLLKFARKNHSSSAGELGLESDSGSVIGSEADDNANNASSGEVHTLKNLISQDETPNAANTSHKSSRHFSLLSPFRSKTSEKKMIA